MFNKPLIFLAGGLLILGAWFLYSREHSPQEGVSFSSVSAEKSLTPLPRGVTTRSNSWFSSLYHGLPSAPLFVYPGIYQWQSQGLSVGIPQVVGTENTVFGSFNAVCEVGNGSALGGVQVERYGDFDFVVKANSVKGETWQAHFMEGSPLVTLSGLISGLSLNCREGINIDKSVSGVWVVKQGEKNLFFIQAAGTLPSDTKSILRSSEGKFRMIQWPTTTEKSLDFFTGLSWSEVDDTQMQVQSEGEMSLLRLIALTKEEKPALLTVWPHHRLATSYPEGGFLGSYDSVLGRLDLIEGREISLRFSPRVLPQFYTPVQNPAEREKIITELKADVARYRSEVKPEGVYFGGTWLGGLATLVQLADTYKLVEERNILIDLLQKHIVEDISHFKYSEEKKMMLATNAEFGSEKGNDHHFHYGYYLRSAAILLQFKPELGPVLKPVMEELARDIATTDRTSVRFPFLRHFDPYAGHSWADGEARFADGNNQESTSEALNAWYALYLWSKAMGNTEREKLSQALYTYELMGARAYWFGENNPFPVGFEHKMASLVWGGKRDYATWFSGEAMHIHGIQWLPMTPASGYLQTLPHFTERKQEILHAHPNPASHEWGDLYVATLSFTEPEEAVRLLPEAQTKRAMKSTALLYHTVYSNLEKKTSR